MQDMRDGRLKPMGEIPEEHRRKPSKRLDRELNSGFLYAGQRVTVAGIDFKVQRIKPKSVLLKVLPLPKSERQ